MKSVTVTGFDYGSLDTEVAKKLQNHAIHLRKAIERFGEAGKGVGGVIHAAHEELAGKGRDGKFKAWVESEGLSVQHAYDMKNVWERSKKYPIIGSFPPTVAYLLSAPTVPEAAIKEFEKQTDKGVKPTVAAAKAVIEKHKPKQIIDVEPEESDCDKPPTQSEAPDSRQETNEEGELLNEHVAGFAEEDEKPLAPSGGITFNPAEWTADTGHTGPMKRVFETAAEFEPARQHLVNLKKALNRIKTLPGGEMLQMGYQRIMSDLDNLDTEIKFAKPFAPCCYCDGNPKHCKACKGIGWLNETAIAAAPKEKKRATA